MARVLRNKGCHCADLVSSGTIWHRLQRGHLRKLGKLAARTQLLHYFEQLEPQMVPPKLKDGRVWRTKEQILKQLKQLPNFSRYLVGQFWLLLRYSYQYPRYLVQSYSEFGPGTKRGLLWLSLGQASENYLFNFIFFLGYTFHE